MYRYLERKQIAFVTTETWKQHDVKDDSHEHAKCHPLRSPQRMSWEQQAAGHSGQRIDSERDDRVYDVDGDFRAPARSSANAPSACIRKTEPTPKRKAIEERNITIYRTAFILHLEPDVSVMLLREADSTRLHRRLPFHVHCLHASTMVYFTATVRFNSVALRMEGLLAGFLPEVTDSMPRQRCRTGIPLAGNRATSCPPSRIGAPCSGAHASAEMISQVAGRRPVSRKFS